MEKTKMVMAVYGTDTDAKDCISRQAVIDVVKQLLIGLPDNDIFRALLKYLREANPVTPRPDWIPVSSHLPKKGGSYLVTIKHGLHTQVTKVFFRPDEGNTFTTGKRGTRNFQDWTDEVSAWMPLPVPYQKN